MTIPSNPPPASTPTLEAPPPPASVSVSPPATVPIPAGATQAGVSQKKNPVMLIAGLVLILTAIAIQVLATRYTVIGWVVDVAPHFTVSLMVLGGGLLWGSNPPAWFSKSISVWFQRGAVTIVPHVKPPETPGDAPITRPGGFGKVDALLLTLCASLLLAGLILGSAGCASRRGAERTVDMAGFVFSNGPPCLVTITEDNGIVRTYRSEAVCALDVRKLCETYKPRPVVIRVSPEPAQSPGPAGYRP